MNRRSLIIILFATIAIALGVLFSFKEKSPLRTEVPVVRSAARPPAVTNVTDGPTEISVSFVGETPTFPVSLPIYQLINHIYTDDEVNRVARSLGFTSLPTRLVYGEETKTLWKTEESTLSFSSNSGDQSWSYGLFQSKTKVVPSQPLLDIARLFIEKNFFPGETNRLVLQQEMVQPIEHIQIAEIPRPVLRGYLFFKETPNFFRVVSDRFSSSLISVVIDQYGVIRSASFAVPPAFSPGKDTPVISVNEAVSSINKGLGLLVSVTKNNDSYWEKTPQFRSVSLTDVQLVYYPNKETLLLVPFYLFQGTAISSGGLVVDVVYAVSAIE